MSRQYEGLPVIVRRGPRPLAVVLGLLFVTVVGFVLGVRVGLLYGSGYVNFQSCITARTDATALRSIRSGNTDAAIAVLEGRLAYTLTAYSRFRRFNDSFVTKALFSVQGVPRMPSDAVRASIQPAVEYLETYSPEVPLEPSQQAALRGLTTR